MQLVKNSEFHIQTKYIDIKYYWICKLIKDSIIKLTYVFTNSMSADELTKLLLLILFINFLHLLCMDLEVVKTSEKI